MNATATLLIYLVIGATIGAAIWLRETRAPAERALRTGAAVLFWPLFAPFLLAKDVAPAPSPKGSATPHHARIAAAEARLLAVLGRLDGAAEEVLAPERSRIAGLGDALREMARRAENMRALLQTAEFSRASAQAFLQELEGRSGEAEDPRVRSVRARVRNIERLEAMHARTWEELERALLETEEIATRAALLEFSGGAGGEALDLIGELAATVTGASEGLEVG